MDFALFSFAGLAFLLRCLHVVFAIAWLGVIFLNYDTQRETQSHTVGAPLSVSMWGLIGVAISGLLLIVIEGIQTNWRILPTSWGASVALASFLSLVMGINERFVSVSGVHVRRMNLILCLPIIFFMEGASHLAFTVHGPLSILYAVLTVAVPIGAFEVALYRKKIRLSPARPVLLLAGFGLTLVMYAIFAMMLSR